MIVGTLISVRTGMFLLYTVTLLALGPGQSLASGYFGLHIQGDTKKRELLKTQQKLKKSKKKKLLTEIEPLQLAF